MQDRSHLGDLLPSQTTLNSVFLELAVDSEAGAFQGRNVQAFVELLARESQAAAEDAADEAEAALATLQQGATEQAELWMCATIAAKAASEASRAAGVASSMATAEQLRLQTAAAEQAAAVARTGTAEPLLEECASKRQSQMLKELVAAPAALAAREATRRAELAAKRAEAAHGAMGALVAREVEGVLEELLVSVESAAAAAAAAVPTEPHPTAAVRAEAAHGAMGAVVAREVEGVLEELLVSVESAAAAAAAAVPTEPHPTAADADAAADAADGAGPAVAATTTAAAAAPAAGELQMAATVAAKEVSPQLLEEHAEGEQVAPVPCFLRADATDIREEKFIHPKTLDWSGDVDLSAIDSINPKELHARFKELYQGLSKYIQGDEEVARAEVAEQLRSGANGEAALVDVLAFFVEHYDRVAREVVELASEFERKSIFYTKKNGRVAAKAAAAAAAAANGGGDGSAPPAKKQRVAAAPQFLGLSDIGNVTEINLKSARLLVTREIEVTFPDSTQPNEPYIGVVTHVHTPEEAGTDDEVWLLAKFEDGDEVSLEAPAVLQNLVPFSKMAPREEKFLKVSNAALAAELMARGKPHSGTKQVLAGRLAAALALEDDGSDPPRSPRLVPGPDSDELTEAEGGAPAPTEEESGAAAAGGTGAQEGAQQDGFEDEDEDAVAALVDKAVAEQQTLFNTGQRKQLAKQQAKLIDKQQLLANMQQVLLPLCLLPLCLLYYRSAYYGSAYYGSAYYGSTYYGSTYYGSQERRGYTYYGSTNYCSTYYYRCSTRPPSWASCTSE